jgi:hypothetical protein
MRRSGKQQPVVHLPGKTKICHVAAQILPFEMSSIIVWSAKSHLMEE